MWLHGRMLSAGGMIGLPNDDIGLGEPLVDIAVANAETMTDIGPGLGTHPKVGRIVIGNRMLIVNKHCTLREGLHCIKNGWKFFIFHIDQIKSRTRELSCWCGHSDYRVA